MTERIVKAFYHRGRRLPLPWTVAELERRTGIDAEQLANALIGLSIKGIARGVVSKRQPTTWELTGQGKIILRRIMEAEALARSV